MVLLPCRAAAGHEVRCLAPSALQLLGNPPTTRLQNQVPQWRRFPERARLSGSSALCPPERSPLFWRHRHHCLCIPSRCFPPTPCSIMRLQIAWWGRRRGRSLKVLAPAQSPLLPASWRPDAPVGFRRWLGCERSRCTRSYGARSMLLDNTGVLSCLCRTLPAVLRLTSPHRSAET
jgi:hypothetical protein